MKLFKPLAIVFILLLSGYWLWWGSSNENEQKGKTQIVKEEAKKKEETKKKNVEEQKNKDEQKVSQEIQVALMRENMLDKGLDIKFRITGKQKDNLVISYSLFNDVWSHRMQKDGAIQSLCNSGFKRVEMTDNYDWSVYWTCKSLEGSKVNFGSTKPTSLSLEGSKAKFGSTKATSLKQSNLKLGLDLIGGAQLIFQASPTEQTPEINQQVMDGLLKVIENRVNASGTTEATVQQVGVDRIMVEIPGVNPELVKRRLLKTAKLEFKERKMDLQGKSPQEILQMRSQIDQYEWVSSGVTGADLKGAQISPDQSGTNWTIAFELKPEGAKKFSEVTGRLAEYTLPLGIFLDDKLVSDPVVQSQISQNGQITGSFTIDEAKDLSVQLNAGALPVPVNLISERTVGATLGQDSINKSLQAGLIGLGLVGIFMVLIYRMPGLLATLALMAYTLISLGVFTRGITLTLAGIAGFILSIGMAVDANILIFERIKEELRNGKAIYKAVEEGFHRAFPSIFDSNLNTLIVCVILGIFGTGLVRGFAITLAVGVIVSFFSAITITRQLVDLTLLIPALKNPIWYGVDNKKKEVISN
ncbi:MAG: protein translocase subunit SecD [Candidatus Melainabacteria bacterium]|jgi:preprotein translocase subunit SecD